jgi:hypothetical protein
MADDWQAGDLALCVAPEMDAKSGGVYTVADVFFDPGGWDTEPGVGLEFREIGAPGFDGYDAWRFRKIKPLTNEERDEFTADLRPPVREPVA